MEPEKKGTRGGARPGAGRPKGDSERFAFKVGGKVARWIKSQECKSQSIIECIREHIERVETGEHIERVETSELDPMIGTSTMEAQGPQLIRDFDVRVACGTPREVLDGVWPEMTDVRGLVCDDVETSFMVRVFGDSMIEAGIRDGDRVVVDGSRCTPAPGRPMLCQLDDTFTIKYVAMHEGRVTLIPANREMLPFDVEAGQRFRTLGTVTGLMRKI